jgi:hypothetical protein
MQFDHDTNKRCPGVVEEFGKEKIKLPFNTYDIFGYVIPGGTFLIGIYLFEFWAKFHLPNATLHLPVYNAFAETSKGLFDKETNWVLSLLYVIILSSVAYVIGHVVSSVSSFFLDRVLVAKGYGYPYRHLLQIDPFDAASYRGAFYRGAFFWVNAYLIGQYIATVFHFPSIQALINSIGWALVGLTVLKLIISATDAHRTKKQKKPLRITTIVGKYAFRLLLAGLYDLLTSSLAKFINTRSDFTQEFRQKYQAAFASTFNLNSITEGSNNYWLSKCYVADKSPVLDSLLVNWLYMYSYARNLATTFYLIFIYGFVSLSLQQSQTITAIIELASPNSVVLGLIPILSLALSMVMLSRYYYLYFVYYSKFLFRAFVYLTTMNQRSATSMK